MWGEVTTAQQVFVLVVLLLGCRVYSAALTKRLSQSQLKYTHIGLSHHRKSKTWTPPQVIGYEFFYAFFFTSFFAHS